MRGIVNRIVRIVVLVVAALCFLLAMFLDWDGLARMLGLEGMAARVALAACVAVAVAFVVARLGRKPPKQAAARRTPRKRPAAARKKPSRAGAGRARRAARRPRG